MPTRLAPPPVAAGAMQVRRSELLSLLRDAIERAGSARRSVAVLMLCFDPQDRLRLFTRDEAQDATRLAMEGLPRFLRPADRYCSVGMEQVCIVLPDLTTTAQAFLAAHKVSAEISVAFQSMSRDLWARVVVGIATYPEQAKDAESLLVNADAATRRARSSETGIGVFVASGDGAEEQQSGVLRTHLLDCLQSNTFSLAYQPQVDLASGRCVSVEALLRATLDDGKPIPPPWLVSAAEQEGKIGYLTSRVLNQALRQANLWSSAGTPLRVAVNLSPHNLRDPDFPAVVARSLESWNVDAGLLTLEIVESSMIDSFTDAAASLHRLKELGVDLSVDDFGTGYSCLAYLRQLPLDELKVDRAFVKNLLHSKQDRQLVRATIDLAHNFDLRAVAEGVEDEATVGCLQEMGCDVIQGYVLSPALAPAAFADWYATFTATASG